MVYKVLGMFVNIFTADDKYSLFNRDNLRPVIQMQLSQKQKIYSELVAPFLISTLNFDHF